MDLTPLLHAAITLAAQAVVGLLTGDWLAGGVLACFWWFGREHAQAEYRWIGAVGNGKRASMPWWGGFDWRAWNLPSLLDWLVPVATTLPIPARCIPGCTPAVARQWSAAAAKPAHGAA